MPVCVLSQVHRPGIRTYTYTYVLSLLCNWPIKRRFEISPSTLPATHPDYIYFFARALNDLNGSAFLFPTLNFLCLLTFFSALGLLNGTKPTSCVAPFPSDGRR